MMTALRWIAIIAAAIVAARIIAFILGLLFTLMMTAVVAILSLLPGARYEDS